MEVTNSERIGRGFEVLKAGLTACSGAGRGAQKPRQNGN